VFIAWKTAPLPCQVPAGLLQPPQVQHGRAQAPEEAEDKEGHPGLEGGEEEQKILCCDKSPSVVVCGVPRSPARSFSLSLPPSFLSLAPIVFLLDIFVP